MAQRNKETTSHEAIKMWSEERGGRPSIVTEEGEETDLLRLDFSDQSDENLKEVEWDDWFQIFDKNDLKLIYQEVTGEGEKSNFNKLVNRGS
jgi:hypothetical protein